MSVRTYNVPAPWQQAYTRFETNVNNLVTSLRAKHRKDPQHISVDVTTSITRKRFEPAGGFTIQVKMYYYMTKFGARVYHNHGYLSCSGNHRLVDAHFVRLDDQSAARFLSEIAVADRPTTSQDPNTTLDLLLVEVAQELTEVFQEATQAHDVIEAASKISTQDLDKSDEQIRQFILTSTFDETFLEEATPLQQLHILLVFLNSGTYRAPREVPYHRATAFQHHPIYLSWIGNWADMDRNRYIPLHDQLPEIVAVNDYVTSTPQRAKKSVGLSPYPTPAEMLALLETTDSIDAIKDALRRSQGPQVHQCHVMITLKEDPTSTHLSGVSPTDHLETVLQKLYLESPVFESYKVFDVDTSTPYSY